MATDVRDAIKQTLAAGRLTVVDSATGYHQSLYSTCPEDGQRSPVWRVEHGQGHAITRVIMRCPNCSTEFEVSPDKLFLG